MPKSLVFVSGGSSGIGLAIARSRPDADTRLIDISRSGHPSSEHFAADLADPAAWPRVAELFEREIAAFSGERVVFFHCAGTLHPMGFAGEVDTADYARNVLLNSASPQLLGHSFLRAVALTQARAHLVCISSGAARSIYEGWSSYGAGKAAVDQWVRIAGAEQERRGGRCRVISVAPGVVATAMQERIRETSSEEFPEVDKFIALHEEGALRSAEEVAEELWALLERELANGSVLDLREATR